MSDFDTGKSAPGTAEPRTIHRQEAPGQAPGKSPRARADTAVNTALGARGSGIAHESGATFHDDPSAHAAADALGARAFTAGSDVYFGAGQYAPQSDAGNELIRHELVHVQQSRGVEAPAPGNFRVSSPGDAAEVAAREGSAAGAGSAATIYRDEEGPPETTGTGPAAGGDATPPDPYAEWKAACTSFNKAEAIAKWAALSSADKQKVKDEDRTFHHRVLFVMEKDSVPVIKDGGIDITAHTYTIFLRPDFADWLPELRTHGLLNTFLAAEPLKHHLDDSHTAKLKTWVDATASAAEAKRIFHKAYPTLHDTAQTPLPFSATALAWPLAAVQRLFAVLQQYMNPGHASTITGGINYVNVNGGFGWWEPAIKRVALPNGAGSTSAANDGTWHDMTGGNARGLDAAGNATGRDISPDYQRADGTNVTGNAARIGHFTGTVLHEVGHGVGDRVDGGRGNAYAENSGSWPGFQVRMNLSTWADELWVDPGAPGGSEPAVHKNAKLDAAHAKDFMRTELAGGNYSLGWASSTPPRADMAQYVKWRYASVPLQKWWSYFVENKQSKDNSYRWDDESARLRNGWCYSYLSRGGSNWTKFKEHTWSQKVSWYSLSSPKEWFAEQYTHFYRTEKTGSGLDGTTATLLKELDKKDFVPTSADGQRGVSIGGSAGSEASAGGENVAGLDGGQQRPSGVEPLFFPW